MQRADHTGRPTIHWVSKTICRIGERAGVRLGERTRRSRKEQGRVETVTKFAAAHDLRRAFGFRWSQRVRPNVLQQLMRHADIKTSLLFYVGENAQAAADAIWAAMPRDTPSTQPATDTFTDTCESDVAEKSAKHLF